MKDTYETIAYNSITLSFHNSQASQRKKKKKRKEKGSFDLLLLSNER